MMRNTAVLIFAIGLVARGAAAGPSLAAPGDCAQPSRELVTEPVSPLPAGVAGPVSHHFAPVGVVDDVRGLLPLDLTRVSLDAPVGVAVEPGSLVEDAGGTLTSVAPDLVGNLAGTLTGGLGNFGGVPDLGGSGNGSGAPTPDVPIDLPPVIDPTPNLPTLPELPRLP